MSQNLTHILSLQDIDMKMIRLMRVKYERQKEIKQLEDLRNELRTQQEEKQKELDQLSKAIAAYEEKIQEINARIKKLEHEQSLAKRADLFNTLTQAMTQAERERIAIEQKVSELVDKRVAEEESLEKVKASLSTSEANSLALENEILSSIRLINEEGSTLQEQRKELAKTVDSEMLAIYERLLRNKKDRVVVPIENRTCSGCHIVLTAQQENLVRKADALVFCEHCSRILYWPEEAPAITTGEEAAPVRRRRRRLASA